jgi:hypothetical protein
VAHVTVCTHFECVLTGSCVGGFIFSVLTLGSGMDLKDIGGHQATKDTAFRSG